MSTTVTRLYENFHPEHYDLAIRLNPDKMTFEGTVLIKGKKAGRPSQRLTFHQKGLDIYLATIRRTDKKGARAYEVARINNQNSFNEVRLHADELLYPGDYVVMLHFRGKITENMSGIYPCNFEHDGQKKKLFATQFESHHAREAFPCIDEPEAKATFSLILNTPDEGVSISNTPELSHDVVEDNRRVTQFEKTPRMSTYLLAFVYGDLQYKEAHTKDGVAVRVWATKAQNAEALDFPLDVGVKAIEFFNDYYGVPYPLSKCDHVALPDFSSAAMENWGLITYREAYLLVDPATTSQSMREVITTVIAHELSHQWFGNLVTMKWWDDLWLNESFANVMEYVATDALFPEWNIWNTFVSHEGLSSLRRDSLPGVQSVKTTVKHPDEIGSLFDPSIVYAKGGRLLNMLMNYLGSDDFRKGLTIYFEKHKYGNTTGNDLWAALAEASGKDVAGFMEPWLTRSGFPVLSVDQVGTDVAIEQNHFLVEPSKADTDRLWPVPLLSTSTEIPDLLETRACNAVVKETGYARINNGASGHYIVHYKQGEHLNFIASLAEQKKLTPAERLMVLSDSALLARADYQSFAASLSLLTYYASEDSEPVWDMISLLIADARRFIDLEESLEAPIKQLIRSLIQRQYERLGWQEIDNEPGEDKKLRATIISLGVYAEHEDITKQALDSFDDYREGAASVSSELRSIVFGAAVRNNVEGAFDYLLDLEETTSNPDLKQELMGALTTTKQPARAEQLLGRIKDPAKVRLHDVDTWVVFLLRNRYSRQLAWNWLRDNWDWIEKTFEGDKSYDSFPRYAASSFNTRTLYEEYKVFFEPLKDNVALSRNIALGIEELDSRVTWLERDLSAIADFLTEA